MRRLCPPCQRDPTLLPTPGADADAGACACATDAWFCPPCVRALTTDDIAYRIKCESCLFTFGCARGRHDCVGLLDDDPVIEQDDGDGGGDGGGGGGWGALSAALEQQGDEQLEDCALDAELRLAPGARCRPLDRRKRRGGKPVAFGASGASRWALPDEVSIPPPPKPVAERRA